ncbi:dipeptidyl-peptidase 3 family protein [Biformimicrobium ophioploci]|uniref:Zn-dependent hydrolase n=1 Tax=Biformimicrobium ophioploci TaxID=3036711 RepID=A0ABQ6LVY3_9GAMM|nr:Zn-dependent hydrolase [Microbulbifer sp. NKW57]GMG86245.1 hypothetical protein MNKW57_05660 [Microbulbifer sp. NKW57]
MQLKSLVAAIALSGLVSACGNADKDTANDAAQADAAKATDAAVAAPRNEIYVPVELTTDLSHLSENQKKMIGLLIDAGRVMDGLFWRQSYGWRKDLLGALKDDPEARNFARINYGPWDRLADNRPFVAGYGPKPKGAQFYPADMTKEEFEAWDEPDKDDLYSLVRRDDATGQLKLVPYSEVYRRPLERAAALLQEAAKLAEHKGFADYLEMRAEALLTDDYQPSDFAWMDVKTNPIDVVIGPIETYEDQLFGYRAAFSTYVLVKDLAWSERLAKFAAFLPELQRGLPVADEYKEEEPGTDSDLNAYDVVFYAGDSNAGSKTIAINLPNDEQVQLEKGTRRLQLKNAMRAKFDKILLPISDVLIAEEQRKHITFPAFFANTMFHEVAHGLGIKKTITDGKTVRAALKETASPLEEGKADILGLYMVTELFNKGEMDEGEVMDNYVTFMAGIFRSVRFGAASAHGRANMMRFNFFRNEGAFSRDEATGHYRVDFDKMQAAMAKLSNLILTIQGDGDYEQAKKLLEEQGLIQPELQADLDRLASAKIPVDVTFIQGKKVLGLE